MTKSRQPSTPRSARSRKRRGFTLIEVVAVIAIIGAIAGIVAIAVTERMWQSRNQRRMADLKQIQKAVEMYYADNGQYPPASCGMNCWRGHCPGYGNDDNYIPALVPRYLPALPLDPIYDDGSRCYLYRSNGNDYAILAHQTMERLAGNEPSNAANAADIRAMDRTCCAQPSVAAYSPGARGW